MVAALIDAKRRIERLRQDRSIVSRDIGAEAATVAVLMLQDLYGWARLFRVKSIEQG